MANPIKPTPTLYSEDAEHFLKIIEEPPSPEGIKVLKEILKTLEEYGPLIKNPDKIHTNHKIQK